MKRYTRRVGRDARTGQFVGVLFALMYPDTSVIETISYPRRARSRRRAVRVPTEENQNPFGSPWS